MNRKDFSVNLKDYNGEGRWSVEAVQMRYREYCTIFNVETPRAIKPKEHVNGDVRWVYVWSVA